MIPDPEATLPPDSPAAASLDRGAALRKRAPRRSHGDWAPAADRVDPVDTLIASNEARTARSSSRSGSAGCSPRRSRSSGARPR